MGVLAECWQTPYSAPSDCTVTGVRVDKSSGRPSTRTTRNASYPPYRGVLQDKHGRGQGGHKDEGGARQPAEKVLENGQNGQNGDRTCIADVKCPFVSSIRDAHSIFKIKSVRTRCTRCKEPDPSFGSLKLQSGSAIRFRDRPSTVKVEESVQQCINAPCKRHGDVRIRRSLEIVLRTVGKSKAAMHRQKDEDADKEADT
ncbi:hypothetical protein OG21DRAFT_1487759 [Imleria badia]|nr:hypothetical protein OG21DRAFT_1487759 [Imleria badia]